MAGVFFFYFGFGLGSFLFFFLLLRGFLCGVLTRVQETIKNFDFSRFLHTIKSFYLFHSEILGVLFFLILKKIKSSRAFSFSLFCWMKSKPPGGFKPNLEKDGRFFFSCKTPKNFLNLFGFKPFYQAGFLYWVGGVIFFLGKKLQGFAFQKEKFKNFFKYPLLFFFSFSFFFLLIFFRTPKQFGEKKKGGGPSIFPIA